MSACLHHPPPEFRQRAVELARQGTTPVSKIAKDLGIAPSTVKNQLTVVFDKLGVSNRTQAAIAARALIKSKHPGL